MWIRSQNNYILANVNSIRIYKGDLDGCAYYSVQGHYDRYEQDLGYYSTKEKALEVLDRIQKYIGSERFYSTTKGISEQQAISSECTKVFQMPQDDDVEAR
jgi:hypothetical protein|uniref:Uncharacterized protein n=1 Tax=Myoviridae sp. ct78050 TaxID=2826617 RepID=A0A8S5R1J5_9CAUD|nr:MAG TPA: hypothetical protein [Myoviridae sp. ct78050]